MCTCHHNKDKCNKRKEINIFRVYSKYTTIWYLYQQNQREVKKSPSKSKNLQGKELWLILNTAHWKRYINFITEINVIF